MAIKKGDKVKVEYKGTLDDGSIFDSSDGREPLEFEVGAGQVIPGFENAVIGMEVGESKKIHIESKDAYGESDPKLLKKIPKEEFPKDMELEVGMMLGMDTHQGPLAATVVKVTEKEVTIDLNHPLSGKALNFEIKVVS
jgi:peptidylprolyl isomerase